MRPTLLGLAVLAGLTLAGCGGEAESSARIKVSPVETPTATSTTTATTTTTPPPGKPAAQTTTTRPAAQNQNSGPSVSISVIQQPSCPVQGTPQAPFSSPGNDVIIGWTVTGATGAALSVDNPKVYAAYGTYAATGQLTLAFPCDTTPGSTTHTYTVWPANNKTVSKTITVSARNNP